MVDITSDDASSSHQDDHSNADGDQAGSQEDSEEDDFIEQPFGGSSIDGSFIAPLPTTGAGTAKVGRPGSLSGDDTQTDPLKIEHAQQAIQNWDKFVYSKRNVFIE